MRAALVALALLLQLGAAHAQGAGTGRTPEAPGQLPPGSTSRSLGDQGQPSAGEEEAMALLRDRRITGRISIPDSRAAVLIQPEGREWEHYHNHTLTWIGGVAVLGMIALLALFYLVRGPIRIEEGRSGRTMLRFNWLERGTHWMTSMSFVVLALTGLNETFGRWTIRPLIGPQAFTDLTQYGKYAHNFLSLPFTIGIGLMFVLWVRDNIPNWGDVAWFRAGGGFFGGAHVPAKRFNAGQKAVFWLTVGGGGIVAVSGWLLIFPFYVTNIEGQQWSHMAHATLSVLMIAAMIAHIYIGSVGMEGGFDAMANGRVDTNWAMEHHSIWVEEQQALARTELGVPADASARAAGAD